MERDTSPKQLQLEGLDLSQLQENLVSDDRKKAFWLNIYNAYYQILRKDRKVEKSAIYRKRSIMIAGKPFSLDDIEHGILRRYRSKYSLGFFANVFASKLIKMLAVDKLDYRIHFALNCGAKSCPPIAFYDPLRINDQLDMATRSFLEGESDFNDEPKVVRTTALFKWFYADFGGKKGIIKIFHDQLNNDISDHKITYKKYLWEDDLANFAP